MLALFLRLRAASRKALQASRCSVYSGNSLAPVRCRVTTHCMGPVPGPGCSRNPLRRAQGPALGHCMEMLLGLGLQQGQRMVPHAARLHQESPARGSGAGAQRRSSAGAQRRSSAGLTYGTACRTARSPKP